MSSLFVSSAPEWQSACDLLAVGGHVVREHRSHHEYVFVDELVLSREATGLRHALWYSLVAGLAGADVVQFDKTRLHVVSEG